MRKRTLKRHSLQENREKKVREERGFIKTHTTTGRYSL